ncbi:MAG: IclR family transcriptional regulator [Actinobacteria bacterium]|nr:IclR family transcriptional regulator [Actinomycetota bacterium]
MKSLKNVFKIIELLRKNKEMRLQEIADELGMYKSMVHRIISDLNENGYVKRNNFTMKYSIGLKFLDISKEVIENLDVRQAAYDIVRELNKITKETIHMAMFLNNQAIYVDKVETEHPIRTFSQIGMRPSFYCTGVGKAIIAFQSPEIINQILDSITFIKFTKNTLTSKEKFLKEINKIQKDGYALDNEEHAEKIICIAAPIRDYTENVVASISITTVTYRMSIKDILKYKDLIINSAYMISKKLGCK